MKVVKKLDCVKMKNEIQAELMAEYDGLSGEEIRSRIQQKLGASDTVVARLWRSLAERKEPAV